MTGQDEQGKKRSTDMIVSEKTPGEVNTTIVNISRYKLFVGFEVNYPDAYKNGAMDIMIDPGHAFFYITNQGIVELFFSFGPLHPPEDDEDATGKRLSTINYEIGELVKLFKLPLTEEQANKINSEVNKIAQEVANKRELYWVKANNTCAAKAKEVLDYGKVETPAGSGPVIASGNDWDKKVLSAMKLNYVNPYQWYSEFNNKYGNHFLYYGQEGDKNLVKKSNFELQKKWMLRHGDPEPKLIQGS